MERSRRSGLGGRRQVGQRLPAELLELLAELAQLVLREDGASASKEWQRGQQHSELEKASCKHSVDHHQDSRMIRIPRLCGKRTTWHGHQHNRFTE